MADNQSQVLRQEILEQSKSEAEEILKQAEREAAKIAQDADVQADKIKSDILRKAESQAENLKKRLLSGVHLDVKKHQLQARESLLSTVFTRLEDKLESYRKSDKYQIFLEKMILEGVLALDSDEIQIQGGDVENKILKSSTLQDLGKKAAKELKKTVQFQMHEKILEKSGIILISKNGRTRFDNRFVSRIERMKEDLRLEAMKMIFKD